MSETRVLGAGARKIGSSGPPPVAPPPAPAAPKKKKRGRGTVIAVLAVLVAVVVGALFGSGVIGGSEDGAPPAPEPGAVITIEPRNINLAEGSYLRLGFAVQLTSGAEEITTAQATDAAIALFSGRPVEEVNDPQVRAELREQLLGQLVDIYGEEVMAVYYTEFVTQ